MNFAIFVFFQYYLIFIFDYKFNLKNLQRIKTLSYQISMFAEIMPHTPQ